MQWNGTLSVQPGIRDEKLSILLYSQLRNYDYISMLHHLTLWEIKMGVSYETYLSLNVIVWIKWSCLMGLLLFREDHQAPACSRSPPSPCTAAWATGGGRCWGQAPQCSAWHTQWGAGPGGRHCPGWGPSRPQSLSVRLTMSSGN